MRHILGIKHLLYYLVVRQLKELDHIDQVKIVYPDEYLEMDVHTIRNLELVETLRLKERTYSLLWLLDKTKTSMGSRKLKDYLMHPLKNIEKIKQNKIEEVMDYEIGLTFLYAYCTKENIEFEDNLEEIEELVDGKNK